MPDQKNPDQLVADSMTQLFSSLGSATANPLTTTVTRPIKRGYRIEGRVLWEDTNEPVAGLTLGLAGVESRTDADGRFEITVGAEIRFPQP
jgi:hypothetical protein